MANLIIKPTSGGSLILQDEGGTAAHTIDASGNHTLANTTTLANATITAGTFPAGHVVRTTKYHGQSGSHISTTSNSFANTGISLSTPATTGSNYNIIIMSFSSYLAANQVTNLALYASKNGAADAQTGHGGGNSVTQHYYYAQHTRSHAMWVDTAGLSAGTNVYKIYAKTNTGTFYIIHSGYDYHLTVQEIKG